MLPARQTELHSAERRVVFTAIASFFFNALIGLWLYFHQPSQHLQISFPSPTRRSGSQWIPYMVKPICNNKGITQRWGKKTSNFKRMQAMVCSVQPGRHGEQEASSGSLDPQNSFNSNGVRELQVNAGGLAFPSTIYIPQDCFAILTLWPSGALIFISYCGDLKKIIYIFFPFFTPIHPRKRHDKTTLPAESVMTLYILELSATQTHFDIHLSCWRGKKIGKSGDPSSRICVIKSISGTRVCACMCLCVCACVCDDIYLAWCNNGCIASGCLRCILTRKCSIDNACWMTSANVSKN